MERYETNLNVYLLQGFLVVITMCLFFAAVVVVLLNSFVLPIDRPVF